MNSAEKDKLLFALLKQAPTHGWTDEALRRTATGKIKLADLMAAFPGGIPDVLTAFADWALRQTLAQMSEHKLVQLRVRDRVSLGVRLWLKTMDPHRNALAAAIRSSWQPSHAITGARNLAKICDVIWTEAGDTATDYNRYTKRILLGAVFTSTLIFWLQDRSKHYEKTAEFLNARIENAMQIGRAASNIKNLPKLFEKAKDFSKLAEILLGRKKTA